MTFLHFVLSLLSNVSASPPIFPSFYPLLEDKMSPNLIALYHLTSMAPLSWMTLPHHFLHDHMASCPGWLHTTLSWMTSPHHILDDHIPLCPEWPHTTISWMTTYHSVLNDHPPPYPGWSDTILSCMTSRLTLTLDLDYSSCSSHWLVFLYTLFKCLFSRI